MLYQDRVTQGNAIKSSLPPNDRKQMGENRLKLNCIKIELLFIHASFLLVPVVSLKEAALPFLRL